MTHVEIGKEHVLAVYPMGQRSVDIVERILDLLVVGLQPFAIKHVDIGAAKRCCE